MVRSVRLVSGFVSYSGHLYPGDLAGHGNGFYFCRCISFMACLLNLQVAENFWHKQHLLLLWKSIFVCFVALFLVLLYILCIVFIYTHLKFKRPKLLCNACSHWMLQVMQNHVTDSTNANSLC